MSGLFLSRVEIDTDAPTRALSDLIDPDDSGAALEAHHRLIWTLFGDRRERERDFLWRAEGRGHFYILSRRPPQANSLFRQPLGIKTFEPDLRPGDRLRFVLRANATMDRARGQRSSSEPAGDRRVDVVMHRLRAVQSGPDRAAARSACAEEAARDWLDKQGERRGFRVVENAVEDYSTVPVRRERRGGRLGVLDLTGIVEVADPQVFVDALATGFGRAKAFGYGLMLVRRASSP